MTGNMFDVMNIFMQIENGFMLMVVAYVIKVVLYITEMVVQHRIRKTYVLKCKFDKDIFVYSKIRDFVNSHLFVKFFISIIDFISYIFAIVSIILSYVSKDDREIANSCGVLMFAMLVIIVLDNFARAHKCEYANDLINVLLDDYMEKLESEKEIKYAIYLKKKRAQERKKQAMLDMERLEEIDYLTTEKSLQNQAEKHTGERLEEKETGDGDCELISQIISEYL